MSHAIDLPDHVQHFRGADYSYDAPHASAGTRHDSSERRTDAEIMAAAMRGTGAPVQVMAPTVRVDARDAKQSASERAMLANNERMRTAWEKPRPSAADGARQDVRADSRGERPKGSASERARLANNERMRGAHLRTDR